MSKEFSPADGRCRCNRVQFRVSAPPIITVACHCKGCQRMSASAFSLSAAIPSEAFSIMQGEPVIGGLRESTRHFFCEFCMSWLFTRPEGYDSFINVRITMLDDPSPYPPYVETYTSERLPWALTPAARSFPQFPPVEEYETLAQAYALHVSMS